MALFPLTSNFEEDFVLQLLAVDTDNTMDEVAAAAGTTLAATMDLVKRGVIQPGESVVVCVTGNGYKTAEVVEGKLQEPVQLSRSFKDFETWWQGKRELVNS